MTYGKAIAIVILIFVVGGGTAAYLLMNPKVVAVVQPATVIHTPVWYESHRDVLHEDGIKCQQEGTNLPAGMCENVSIAAQSVSSSDFLNALNQASSSGK